MWGQNTLIISSLSPKRDWGPERAKRHAKLHNAGEEGGVSEPVPNARIDGLERVRLLRLLRRSDWVGDDGGVAGCTSRPPGLQ